MESKSRTTGCRTIERGYLMCEICHSITEETENIYERKLCKKCAELLHIYAPKAMELYYLEDCFEEFA